LLPIGLKLMSKKNNQSNAVAPKKHLGQHFLIDKGIAQQIAEIVKHDEVEQLIEIGPGMGVLSEYLYSVWKENFLCIEIDKESVAWLKNASWAKGMNILEGDYLRLAEEEIFKSSSVGIIGNYPYNISTQIAFRILESKQPVQFFGGMFQKEVARRFCSVHGNKEYGITSVLLQAWYDCEYLFTVEENAFNPPPKVKSGVIACHRKKGELTCSYKSLSLIVKTGFNQRRKTLSNALKPLTSSKPGFVLPEGWGARRAEQLSVQEFIELATAWQSI
jgi:16S rRNA (adenine1518-N6/adenine1519-N6)-dimethyltransferase